MKTLLIPLDERPCNYQYPQMISQTNQQIELIVPPQSLLGNKKEPASLEKLDHFIYEHFHEVDNIVLSIDMIVYGGLIPSRLHCKKQTELISRLNVIKRLKEMNPKLKIYAFNCIMRCPSYNSAEKSQIIMRYMDTNYLEENIYWIINKDMD